MCFWQIVCWGSIFLPCRELTYALPASTFESMIFLLPLGGICDRFLEDTLPPHNHGSVESVMSPR